MLIRIALDLRSAASLLFLVCNQVVSLVTRLYLYYNYKDWCLSTVIIVHIMTTDQAANIKDKKKAKIVIVLAKLQQ